MVLFLLLFHLFRYIPTSTLAVFPFFSLSDPFLLSFSLLMFCSIYLNSLESSPPSSSSFFFCVCCVVFNLFSSVSLGV